MFHSFMDLTVFIHFDTFKIFVSSFLEKVCAVPSEGGETETDKPDKKV